MKTTPTALRKKLLKISKELENSIRKEVALEALDHSYENPADFFQDLLQYGCACGMIGSLIYYVDTRNFYDKYYQEIEGLRWEFEENTGEPLQIKGDLKNFYAWFGFEETAYQLANELELEV